MAFAFDTGGIENFLGLSIFRYAPPSPNNRPPVVNAGPYQEIILPGGASLSGMVTDDGLPTGGGLTTTWSKVSGPGNVTFANPAAASTTATFDQPGIYVLRLTASDGQMTTTDDMTIRVQTSPPQQIPTPRPTPQPTPGPPLVDLTLTGRCGQGCQAIAVQGSYAYVGEGANLRILNIADPAHPLSLAGVMMPEQVNDVAVAGTLVCVADGGAGLQIIDVSNPIAPIRRGICPTQNAFRVAVAGSWAYVCDGGSLLTIDVSNPDAPVLRRNYVTLGWQITAMAISGSLIYLAESTGPASLPVYFEIVDVSNPAAPTRRGNLTCPVAWAGDIAISGNLAYVMGLWRSWGTLGQLQPIAEPLQVIDVSNPDAPVKKRGFSSIDGQALTVSGSLAFVAARYSIQHVDRSQGSLQVWRLPNMDDLQDQPVLLAEYQPVSGGQAGSYINLTDLVISGSTAYLGDQWAGLEILDLSQANQGAISPLGSYVMLSNPSCFAVSGSLAYVADGNRFEIIDMSNPLAPVPRGSCDISGITGIEQTFDPLSAITLSGPWAYIRGIRGGNSTGIIDVSNPDAPSVRSIATYFEYISGSWAYLNVRETVSLPWPMPGATDTTTLKIYSLADPDSPELRGNCVVYSAAESYSEARGVVSSICSSGSFLYLILDDELQIVDVSNPAAPVRRGQYNLGGQNGGFVAVSGSRAFVLISGQLWIIDVANPDAPVLRGIYRDADPNVSLTFPICASDNLVYMSTVYGTLQIVNISDPSAPTLCGTYTPPGNARINDFVVSGSLIYVLDDRNGLTILSQSIQAAAHPPSPPRGLEALGTPDNHIHMSWTPNREVNISGYNVYRDTQSTGTFSTKLNSSLIREPGYVDATAESGRQYFYLVTAVNAQQLESAMSAPVGAFTGLVTLTMPDFRGAPGGIARLQINCDYATGIAGNGMEIRLEYNKYVLTPLEVQKTALTQTFTITDNSPTANGLLQINGSAPQGVTITGQGHLMDILFRVSPSAALGITASNDFEYVKMYDVANNLLSLNLEDAAIFTVADDYLPGDVNADGVVNDADVIIVQQAAVGQWTLTSLQMAAADLNGDGQVDNADVTLVQRLAAGLPINPESSGGGSGSIRLQDLPTYQVEISDASGQPSTNIPVPVRISNTFGVAGIQLGINYDPLVLSFMGVAGGALTHDFSLARNDYEGNIALSRPIDLGSGSGELAILYFRVIGQPGQTSPLVVSKCKLSGKYGEDLVWLNNVSTVNGLFTVAGPVNAVGDWLLYE